MQLLEGAQVPFLPLNANHKPLIFMFLRMVQELDFFEMSQGKPDEKEVAVTAAAATKATAGPTVSAPQFVSHPSLAVSIAPPSQTTSMPAQQAPLLSRRRVILSSDDDDDAPPVASAAPLPGRKSLVPVDASGGCSVESQPLIIIGSSSTENERCCSPSATSLCDNVSRDLRRMSVANGVC